jgi:hypothetical protein
VERIGYAALAFAVAFLACGGALASDIERQIPVIRDSAGSGLTMEISREGTRQTATPFLTLYDPTSRQIGDRIAKKTSRLMAKETPPGATAADSTSPVGLTGTPREGTGQPGTALASLPLVPGEITIRSVKTFLKSLRTSRKEKPAPAVVVPAQELRFGRAN